MVEIFKTNVNTEAEARLLARLIENTWSDYCVNFALDDADRILRIVPKVNDVDSRSVIALLLRLGYEASVLADEAVEPLLPAGK